MNDNELDGMLNKWEAPEVPARLRHNLQAALKAREPRRRFAWMTGFVPRVLATAVLGFGMLAFVVSKANPQTGNVPYAVESEVTQFFDDGSSDSAHVTSYNRQGVEVLISLYKPDSPLWTMFGNLVRHVHGIENQQARGRAAFFIGCAQHPGCFSLSSISLVSEGELLDSHCQGEGAVVGHETILGYPAVAVEPSFGGNRRFRMTVWRAPGLGCFALRVKTEKQNPDGSYRMTAAKQALKVTVSK